MIRDITIGQYYRAESVIHRLDPRVKLLTVLLFIISLFVFSNPIGLTIAAVFLLVVIGLSKVPFAFIVRGLKPLLFFLLITIVFNLFLVSGEPALKIWRLTITWEGIQSALYLSARLIMLILGSSVMTLTTTPNKLTDGIESLLKPLKVIRVPAHEIAMMMSIALRFIPILLEETDIIMKAQTARGADFESGNLIKKAKGMVPILIPLFVAAFRRAGDLAMAMEARCYRGSEGRTRMNPLKYKKRDAVGYLIFLSYLGIESVVCFVLG